MSISDVPNLLNVPRSPIVVEPLEARCLLSAGLTGQYFDRENFAGEMRDRTDTKVNFDFGDKAPIKGMGSHGYSIRWSGLITPDASENYRFILEFEGRARLWVDGKKLIDQWTPQSDGKESGSIHLKAGRPYDIRLEYSSHSGAASAKLLWRSPSIARQVVPAASLRTYDKRFASLGDYGEASAEENDVARMIESWRPDFVITTGDNNYTGSMDLSVGQYYQQFIGKYKGQFGDGSATNRFFPSVGNHDWDNGIANYTSFFHLPGNERYYDFVRGPVHFFVVSSDPHEADGNTVASPQGKWLKHALSESTSAWNVVYFHHPAYSSAHGHGSTPNMQWPFKEWGADMVLSGHDHVYERLEKNGVAYFVNGLGGSHIYGFGAALPESQVRYNADFGAMLIQSTDDVTTCQFITRTGRVVDSYTLRRKPASSSARTTAAPLVWSSVGHRDPAGLFSQQRVDKQESDRWWDSEIFMEGHDRGD